jgi:hypothetical protein
MNKTDDTADIVTERNPHFELSAKMFTTLHPAGKKILGSRDLRRDNQLLMASSRRKLTNA